MGYPDPDTPEGAATGSYAARKPELLNRLSRIEGQIRGLHRMVDNDQYCVDVLTQIAAAKAALDRVALVVLDDHIKSCVAGAVGTDLEGPRIEELVGVLERFVALRK